MLDKFISENRDEIVCRTRDMGDVRSVARARRGSLRSGVTLFLEHLVARLRHDDTAGGQLAAAASDYGSDMLQHGFTVAQVVQGYGDVCQVITSLALERNVPITTDEFRTLNGCLDTATAEAVSEFERQRDRTATHNEAERLGFLAHELRNKLNTAMMSFAILKTGSVYVGGSTGAVLGRSLSGLRELVDRALTEVRLDSGVIERERLRVWDFIEDVEVVARFEANAKGLHLAVTCEQHDAELEIDRHIIASAVTNLLQNAFKFTPRGGHIALAACIRGERALIEVADECGGLETHDVETLFQPFEKSGADRTGLGLGLAISRRGVEAHGGRILVQDRPRIGCVFTIELPLAARQAHVAPGSDALRDLESPTRP